MRKLLNIIYNYHWIVPGDAARSAQAYAGFLGPFLKKNGIKAVINLRGRHPKFDWWAYESAVCAELGVAHFDAMMDSRRLPLKDMLAALFDAFDAAPRPFLVKCSGGQDRTSFAAALYLVHRGGWNAMEPARAQFARLPYLHFPRRNQRWLVHFLDYARDEAGRAALAEWVRRAYDPQAFAAWLNARGLGDAYNGIWEPWKPRSK